MRKKIEIRDPGPFVDAKHAVVFTDEFDSRSSQSNVVHLGDADLMDLLGAVVKRLLDSDHPLGAEARRILEEGA